MATSLERLKSGYTNGGRGAAQRLMAGAGAIPITPNQLTVLGFAITACSGVLLYERQYVLAAIVFVVGSVLDALDGALARAHGKGTPFGGFLDSTLDRVSDGIILGAIALVLAEDGDMLALACVWGVARFFNDAPQELVSPAPNVVDSAGLATKAEPDAETRMTLAPLEVTAVGATPQVVVRDRDGRILWAGKLAEDQRQQVIGLAPFEVTSSNGSAVKVSFLGKRKGTVGEEQAAASRQFG